MSGNSDAKLEERGLFGPDGFVWRDLKWGDINILHTTDMHGWLLGHQKGPDPEPSANGTFADLRSFVVHMKQIAKEKGVDLLVVDTGDLHHGTGLCDGCSEGEVNGHDSNEIVAMFPYDLLTVGNHELQEAQVATDVHKHFVPKWGGKYLASNVSIYDNNKKEGNPVPFAGGDGWLEFNTPVKNLKVLSFGIMFHQTKEIPNTTVEDPDELVKKPWFVDVVKRPVDLFLLVGHMPIGEEDKQCKWRSVVTAIRDVEHHKHTPILIFGGHTHVRDWAMFDERCMAIQSGRFMDTVGWMSAKVESDQSVTFSRRFLDANRSTYMFHAGKNKDEDFDTPEGKEISDKLYELSKKYSLDEVYGVAPRDFFTDRYPVTSDDSVVKLFTHQVLPTVFRNKKPEKANPHFVLVVGSGSQRYDLFKGDFTRNDQFVVSPFTTKFKHVKSIPCDIASQVANKIIQMRAAKAQMGAIAKMQALTPAGSGIAHLGLNTALVLPNTQGNWGLNVGALVGGGLGADTAIVAGPRDSPEDLHWITSVEDMEAEAESEEGSGAIEKRWAKWRKQQWESYEKESWAQKERAKNYIEEQRPAVLKMDQSQDSSEGLMSGIASVLSNILGAQIPMEQTAQLLDSSVPSNELVIEKVIGDFTDNLTFGPITAKLPEEERGKRWHPPNYTGLEDSPDDTPHKPVPYIKQESPVSHRGAPDSFTIEGVDLVFVQTHEDNVKNALRALYNERGENGAEKVASMVFEPYGDFQCNTVFAEYAKLEWESS